MTKQELSVGGAVVFWQLATANRDYVSNALSGRGYADLMPEPPTPLACLKSALSEAFPTKSKERVAIRPVEGGYAVVVEPPKDTDRRVGDNWGEVKATAVLTDEEDEYTLTLNPYNPELRESLFEAMRTKRRWLTPTAVGKIMVSLVEKLDGTSYRDNGVVYWMPGRSLNSLEQIADEIELAPKRDGDKDEAMVHILSVCANQRLLKAVCAGLTEEVSSELAAIEADLAEGSLKEEACLNRLVKAGQLQQKVRRYEADMGTQLTALNAAIEKTSQAVAWTTMQVSNSAIVKDAMVARC